MAPALALVGELFLEGPEYTCVLHAHDQYVTLNVPHLKALQDIKKQVGLSAAQGHMLTACLAHASLKFIITVRHQPVLVMGAEETLHPLRQRVNQWLGIPRNGQVFFKRILSFWRDLL